MLWFWLLLIACIDPLWGNSFTDIEVLSYQQQPLQVRILFQSESANPPEVSLAPKKVYRHLNITIPQDYDTFWLEAHPLNTKSVMLRIRSTKPIQEQNMTLVLITHGTQKQYYKTFPITLKSEPISATAPLKLATSLHSTDIRPHPSMIQVYQWETWYHQATNFPLHITTSLTTPPQPEALMAELNRLEARINALLKQTSVQQQTAPTSYLPWLIGGTLLALLLATLLIMGKRKLKLKNSIARYTRPAPKPHAATKAGHNKATLATKAIPEKRLQQTTKNTQQHAKPPIQPVEAKTEQRKSTYLTIFEHMIAQQSWENAHACYKYLSASEKNDPDVQAKYVSLLLQESFDDMQQEKQITNKEETPKNSSTCSSVFIQLADQGKWQDALHYYEQLPDEEQNHPKIQQLYQKISALSQAKLL